MLMNVLNDTSTGLHGKKLHLAGNDSASYMDVNHMVKQASHKGSSHSTASPLLFKLNVAFQLFFNGNNHINNMVSQLSRSPNLLLKSTPCLPS